MNRKQIAARIALRAYAATLGGKENREPREAQIADLVADLLVTLDAGTAERILATAERIANEDRDDATAAHTAI